MGDLISRKDSKDAISRHARAREDVADFTAEPLAAVSNAASPLLRKAACACGGGCPSCKSGAGNLKVSHPSDAAEIEADRIADRVMRMPVDDVKPKSQLSRTPNTIHRKCDACEDEDKMSLRRKPLSSTGSLPPATPARVQSVLSTGGGPLDKRARSFFEPRFGHDLSAVRVHADSRASALSETLNAEAFTIGNQIVFGQDRYRPDTERGRHLLAHELAHIAQQNDNEPKIHRRLVVNSAATSLAPSTDPAASLTPVNRLSMMDSILNALCPDFSVNSGTGEVEANSSPPPSRSTLASGSKPVGCCCLEVLTGAANTWTIEVSQLVGPHTLRGSRQVVLSPTTTPIEFGSFTSAGNLAFQGQVPAAGHELCGHAALFELNAHPIGNRLTTDVHDPTVRIENLVSTEQGVPASDLRGLARDPHRGESVDRIVVSGYPLNGTDPSGLPAAERNKLRFAANYAVENDGWVDIIGHSDFAGSAAAKTRVSQERADKAQTELVGLGVPNTITKHGLTGVPRFTRVQGVGDSQPLPGAPSASSLRRIEVLIAGFPAGAQVAPAGTPTGVTATAIPLAAQQTPADPCEAVLIGGAFPP
jgi:hypothetical protein